MRAVSSTIGLLLGAVVARPQGSIEKDAEWTVQNLVVHSKLAEGTMLLGTM